MGYWSARLDQGVIHSESKIKIYQMKKTSTIILSICSLFLSLDVLGQTLAKDEFQEPSVEFWPRPLWFWNNTTITIDGIENQMKAK